MKGQLVWLLLGGWFAFYSCYNTKSVRAGTPLSSGIVLENMDTLVRPGDNFAAFVNGNSKEGQLPRFYKFGRTVEDSLLQSILRSTSLSAEERIFKDVYNALTDFKTRDSVGLLPLQKEFDKITNIQNRSELLGYFGYANTNGYNVPLKLEVSYFKDLKRHVVLISEGGLSLKRASQYLQNETSPTDEISEYEKYIQALFQIVGHSFSEEQIVKVVGLERDLANLHAAITQRWQTEGPTYLIRDFSVEHPVEGLDLESFLKQALVNKKATVGTYLTDYLEGFAKLFQRTDMELWKSYLKWCVLSEEAPFLNQELLKVHQDFHKRNPDDFAKAYIKSDLKDLMNQIYIQHYCPEEVKTRVEQMTNDFAATFSQSISTLDWMSDITRNEALQKLKKLKKIIGYVEPQTDYHVLKIAPNAPFENRRNLSYFKYQQSLALLERSEPDDRNRHNPRFPNGYYLGNENKIWIAAMLLNPPYFNKDADEAVNYGALGAVIGHELGHGFDTKGSTYDSHGEQRNWWTDDDLKAFHKRTAILEDQFNGYEIKDGHFVNGKTTLNENIADLTGLVMAVRAYKQSKHYNKDNIIDGFTPMQRLFIGYAGMYDSPPNDDYLIRIKATSRYPPSRYRINGVVRNSDAFYEAFHVESTDSLYLPPEKRAKIW